MRRVFTSFVALAVLLPSGAFAQDKPPAPGPASAPPRTTLTNEQAADAVLAAVAGKDDAALKALAAKDDPDPWIVADELLLRGRADEAQGFAGAAPRVDTEKLPGYVRSRRGRSPDAAARKSLVAAEEALAAGRFADALASIDAVKATDEPVVAIRLEHGRGLALRGSNRLEESAAAFGRAAASAEATGWIASAAGSFRESARSYFTRGDFPLAIEVHGQALRLYEIRSDRAGVARSLRSIGASHDNLGHYRKALEFVSRALEINEALGNEGETAECLQTMGRAYGSLRDFRRALESLERAGEICARVGDRRREATVLQERSGVHLDMGAYSEARSCAEQALKLSEALKDPRQTTKSLVYLGNALLCLAEFGKALDCYERGLNLHEELGERVGVGIAMQNMSLVYEALGDSANALRYAEGALERLLASGDSGSGAITQIGLIHMATGNWAKALEFTDRALKLDEELGDAVAISIDLTNLGEIHLMLGDTAKAMDCGARALKLKEGSGGERYAGTLWLIGKIHERRLEFAEATDAFERGVSAARKSGDLSALMDVLVALARSRRLEGRHQEALIAAHEAVDVMSLIARHLEDELSASARSKYSSVYSDAIASAAISGDTDAAVFFAESGRAGALREAFKTRDTVASGVLPGPLREAERVARTREASAAGALRTAVDGGDLDAIKSARTELDSARVELSRAVSRIQREAKAIADVAYPTADSPGAMLARLREGEALALYALLENAGDEAVAVVITAKSVRTVRLGSTSRITTACAALNLADTTVEFERGIGTLRDLLIGPLGFDSDVVRLLVSPEGALSYVPFALLMPEREVAYVPSGTTYGVLLDDAAKRGDGVLALGDPDYGAKAADGAVAMRSGGYGNLMRLPATGVEAKAVGDVVLLAKDATEQGLRDALAKKPRWRAVHLACHGLVDPERPMFSSLALTPSGEDDGFLTALEVFRMKCPADLVVLSACETGKGRVYKAEGIVGLTRAFMFAGAPRVLVSLWKVDDEATRALMTKFYELWNPKDGKGVAAATALRKAQEFVRSQEKWKHPRFWAAWTIWGLPD